jgi:hypothetical protein
MRKQTNTLSPSPKGFQSPKFLDSDSDSDSDVRKALTISKKSREMRVVTNRRGILCVHMAFSAKATKTLVLRFLPTDIVSSAVI